MPEFIHVFSVRKNLNEDITIIIPENIGMRQGNWQFRIGKSETN